MNEVLFFVTIIINFICILGMYKFLGKTGLYVWIAFATVLANIEVIKCVDMFGMALTLGNVLYGTITLSTDILNENYGKKHAKKAVTVGFIVMLLFTILSQLAILFVPNSADFASESLKIVFSLSPRIFAGSLIAYFISNNLNVLIFDKIKSKIPDSKLFWIRNNASTVISQFVDTVIFTLISFLFVFDLKYCIILIFTTYIIKVLIAILDTPFLYIAKKLKKNVKEI